MMRKVVNSKLVFAFADSANNLDQLKQEQKEIANSFLLQTEMGLLALEIIPFAEIIDITNACLKPSLNNVFEIFHFGGHGNEDYLFLEGAHKKLRQEGMAVFLGAQEKLKVAFFNCCLSADLARESVKKGVPVAIGTTGKPGDYLARMFAVSFYKALAGGDHIQAAFDKANGTARMIYDFKSNKGEIVEEDRFPYQIFVAPGTEVHEHWTLPSIAPVESESLATSTGEVRNIQAKSYFEGNNIQNINIS